MGSEDNVMFMVRHSIACRSHQNYPVSFFSSLGYLLKTLDNSPIIDSVHIHIKNGSCDRSVLMPFTVDN